MRGVFAILLVGTAAATAATWGRPRPRVAVAPMAVLVSESFDPANTTMLTAAGGRLTGSHTMDPTGGRTGAALKVTVAGGSIYNPVQLNWPPRGRIFLRWYFRTQGVPGGNVKGMRFHDGLGGTNLGEVYGGNPCWSFDQEGEALCFPVGLSYTATSPDCPALANSGWHSIEVDYDRSAGENVETRLWCDGRPIVLPPGPIAHPWGGTYAGVTVTGGNREAGTPSTIRTARRGPGVVGSVGLWEMISSASGSATVWVDDIVISTSRIGP